MGKSSSKHRRSQSDELTRDEVWVAEGAAPEEWRRNNALFGYRLIKRTGWIGKVYVALVVGGIAFALLSGAWSALRALGN